MTTATYKGVLLASSENCIFIEDNFYFPPETVNSYFLHKSDTHTICKWKGVASYFHVAVAGDVLPDAAWFYPNPKPEAAKIKNYVAFGDGVVVEPQKAMDH